MTGVIPLESCRLTQSKEGWARVETSFNSCMGLKGAHRDSPALRKGGSCTRGLTLEACRRKHLLRGPRARDTPARMPYRQRFRHRWLSATPRKENGCLPGMIAPAPPNIQLSSWGVQNVWRMSDRRVCRSRDGIEREATQQRSNVDSLSRRSQGFPNTGFKLVRLVKCP